ncbi:MAG: succinylglutamate desuccinylase/aspartoacylase family protein [Patescibacteria group bacterium]
MNRLHSYEDEVVYQIRKLLFSGFATRFSVESLGKLKFGRWQYPLYKITVQRPGNNLTKRDILLSGIVHGDEPAGGLGILHFLDRHIHHYLDRFNFHCYPCVNPSGFEAEMRMNMDYINLNRSFTSPPPTKEVELIQQSLQKGPSRYFLTMDMHESPPLAIDPKEDYGPEDNPSAFWMWETAIKKSGLRIGDKIVAQLRKENIHVCDWPKVYGETNNGGVIWYPIDAKGALDATGKSLDAYLYKNHTNHSLTVETPTCWPLETRIRTHARIICLALDYSLPKPVLAKASANKRRKNNA